MRQGLLTLLLLLASFTNAGASMVQDGSSEDAKRSQPGEQKDEKKGRAKDKKKVEELRPGSAEGDEIEKLMRDITDGMKRIEDLLKERETGQATQSAQQSTLDSIEELIKAAEKAQQQSQSSGSGSGGKPKNDKERGQQDQKQGQQQRQNKDQSELNREEDGQKDADKERQEKNPTDSEEQSQHNESGEDDLPAVEIGTLGSKEGQGRWGRLPKTIIEQMYNSGQRKLPVRYRVLLEEYFRRLPTTTKKK